VFRLAYLNERGAVAQAGGDLAYALKCSLAAVRGWPENSASWGNLALVYEELGQRENAITAISTAVGRSVDLRYSEPLIGWLLQADRVEEAARHGEDAVRFHPGDGHAHALRALTRLSLIAVDPLQGLSTRASRVIWRFVREGCTASTCRGSNPVTFSSLAVPMQLRLV
jgi:tetratricopeptide (TPR) repeat protein